MSQLFDYTKVTVLTDPPLSFADSPKLRGFFAREYTNRPEFHQHSGDGKLVYEHPLIQYKVIGGAGILTGLDSGALLLKSLEVPEFLTIGGRQVRVLSASMDASGVCLAADTDLHSYAFVSPWVALNQENFRKYRGLQDPSKGVELLERILVGNLLSLSKSVGHHVETRLEVELHLQDEEIVRTKGFSSLGFTGSFRSNFPIPPLWGIGKMSSRGFGSVQTRRNTHA